MLKQLEISNYAIIDKIKVDFSDQLTIVTGETGAGKSILMGALGLILGRRADTKVLYDDSRLCFVEGIFDIKLLNLKTWFDENQMDYADELIIRREISPSGKSRAFLNDGLVTLSILKSLSFHLIDIFAQFDTLDIQQQEEQFAILDTVADQRKHVKAYQQLFDSWTTSVGNLEQLKQLQGKQLKEEDYLRFQLEELESLNLKPGEIQELERKQERMSKSVDIQQACREAVHILQDNPSTILSQLNKLANGFRNINTDIPEIHTIIQRLESSFLELEDLAHEIEQFSSQDLADDKDLSWIEGRLSTIYTLLRKHQVQKGEQLNALKTNIENKLLQSESLDTQIRNLELQIEQNRQNLLKKANSIHKKRRITKKKLEKETKQLLNQLAMPNAILDIDLTQHESLNRFGNDAIEFLFTANLGGRLLPIKQVASGGELSRLNLCLKSIVAGKTTLPTLIFDEIDSGISGMVAEKMGKMIHQLAKHHQIISITHSPQIAAKANQHYYVYKEGHAGRTQTKIKALNSEERITEIATMLSTNPPSKSALANARELLNL